ncbi:hypothetical protein [Nostoc sp.]|uniref:hypothetical protein n=1 Tax=Nostoc sp. TaxID=1180 RepID=UPI002FFC815E
MSEAILLKLDTNLIPITISPQMLTNIAKEILVYSKLIAIDGDCGFDVTPIVITLLVS